MSVLKKGKNENNDDIVKVNTNYSHGNELYNALFIVYYIIRNILIFLFVICLPLKYFIQKRNCFPALKVSILNLFFSFRFLYLF
jgi:hypothetical protein